VENVLDPYDKKILDTILKRRRITESGCWEYTRGTIKGYGSIFYGGYHTGVHRVVYKILCPDKYKADLLCCHNCDNRLCFNPEHLYMGTFSDNISDAYGRERRKPKGPEDTHCSHGHEYNEKNTYHWRGRRYCRICIKERMREKAKREGGYPLW